MNAPGLSPADNLDVNELIEVLAHQLEPVLHDESNPCLIGIQRRGDILARRLGTILNNRLGIDIPIGTLDITLYRDDFDSLTQTPIVGKTEIPFAIDDRTVVLVDDVLYTGRTIRAALDELLQFGRAGRILLVALIDRGWRELPIAPDLVGCTLETGREDTVQVLLQEVDGRDDIEHVTAGASDPT